MRETADDRGDSGDETHAEKHYNSDADLASSFIAYEPSVKVTKFDVTVIATV